MSGPHENRVVPDDLVFVMGADRFVEALTTNTLTESVLAVDATDDAYERALVARKFERRWLAGEQLYTSDGAPLPVRAHS